MTSSLFVGIYDITEQTDQYFPYQDELPHSSYSKKHLLAHPDSPPPGKIVWWSESASL